MPTLTLRLTIGLLAVIALLGGAAIVSADDGDADTVAIEWMHDRMGDHDVHHDGHADHDHGANHAEHHADHEPGTHHTGGGGC